MAESRGGAVEINHYSDGSYPRIGDGARFVCGALHDFGFVRGRDRDAVDCALCVEYVVTNG